MPTKEKRPGGGRGAGVGSAREARSSVILPDEHDLHKERLLQLYLDWFMPDPEARHAVQNPFYATNQYYSPKQSGNVAELVRRALEGTKRQVTIWPNGREGKPERPRVPTSLAVIQHKGGAARVAVIDVDKGGIEAIRQGLIFFSSRGLFAFAQISTSAHEDGTTRHDGGHIWAVFDRPHDMNMLRNLAQRVALAADLDGEAYPSGSKLRPPLMHQLRAPGGPRRFSILLPSGEVLDPNELGVWSVLDRLFSPDVWRPNTPSTLISALEELPPLKAEATNKPRRPRHKSNVNPDNAASVIDWYNQNHPLEELLEDAGADLSELKGTSGVIRCPYHDDRNPSFLIWRHDKRGYLVGKCKAPSCRAHVEDGRLLDAFNLYQLATGESHHDAVKNVSRRYGLGTKRTYRSEEQRPIDDSAEALNAHQEALSQAREALGSTLREAAHRRGVVTVVNAVMGLGKTHTGHEIAEELHKAGQRVAIVAPNHAHAAREWGKRLGELGFIWQPKTLLCTCHDRGLLSALGKLGYRLPDCMPGCAYLAQHTQREGRVTVYQYNHLHLNDGELLTGHDVIFIDESPLSSLLEAHSVTQDDVRRLFNGLSNLEGGDPATTLLKALWRTGREHTPRRQSLRGAALVEALEVYLPMPLLEAIERARGSVAAHKHPHAPGRVLESGDTSTLGRVFLGKLLDALEQTARNPESGHGLAWGLENGGGAWLWYERHDLAKKCRERLDRPAVIALDGSAIEQVNVALFAPWPVETIAHELPISPLVKIIKAPTLAHTRRIVQDQDSLRRTAQYVGMAAQQAGLTLKGGVTFKSAVEPLGELLGGEWLHYGGQRGRNDLEDTNAIALVGSPNVPPDTLERLALALFDDGQPLTTWPARELWKRVGAGDYHAHDRRLEAVARLHGPEELRQAAHRARLVLADVPKTVIVASPWSLESIGLTPHETITELPTPHSTEGKELWEAYRERLSHADGLISSFSPDAAQNVQLSRFSTSINDKGLSPPHVEKAQSCTQPQDHDQVTLASGKEYKPVVLPDETQLVDVQQIDREAAQCLMSGHFDPDRLMALLPHLSSERRAHYRRELRRELEKRRAAA